MKARALDFPSEYDFSHFLSTSHPDTSYPVFNQLAQRCRNSLLKQTADATRRTTTENAQSMTDIDRSQKLILSILHSSELIRM